MSSTPTAQSNTLQETSNRIKKVFPSQLLSKPIWLAYYYKRKPNGKVTKPPLASKGYSINNSLGKTFDEVIQDGFPGLMISPNIPIIAFDIDDKLAKEGKRPFLIENLPKEFRRFLHKANTYTEYSPSGKGLRVLFLCKDKTSLPGRAILNEYALGGELYCNTGYVTITGRKIYGDGIKMIKADKLSKWFLVPSPKIEPTIDPSAGVDKPEFLGRPTKEEEIQAVAKKVDMNLPSVNKVIEALESCDLSKSERTKKIYTLITNETYNHYDYWIKILAACYDYAVKSNRMNDMTSLVVEWSKTDPEDYVSDADVLTHWSSFDENRDNKITYNTLFKFAQLLKFKWPQEEYIKGRPTGKPLVNSIDNFLYLMDYYEIQVFEDMFNNSLYISGNQKVMQRYLKSSANGSFFGMLGPFSMEALFSVFWRISQDNGYVNIPQGTIVPLVRYFLHTAVKRTNLMDMWLNTEPANMPKDMQEQGTDIEKSNLKYLMKCIKFSDRQDKDLAYKFFETFFYELVMPIYNKERKYSQRSFMLVLTGPENCRKTTFFSMLFPPTLRPVFVTNSTETLGGAKSIRDFSTFLVTSALVITDEFEIFYNKKNDSLFKTYVTSDVIDYIPIYEKSPKKAYKNAVIVGTTNKTSLPFEQDSNRRLALVEVEHIDTSAMEVINWHHFYNTFVKKGRNYMNNGLYPWKLSSTTIKHQYQENERFRAKSNLEIMLTDCFDFNMISHDEPIKWDVKSIQGNPNLYSALDVTRAVQQKYPSTTIKPAELRQVLRRLCGKYTKTSNRLKKLSHVKGSIENGMIEQGKIKRYVMPPLIVDSFDSTEGFD